MRIKRFQAVDMRAAMEQVRGALGPDAVIISTRGLGATPEEKRRGLRGIEVVAGVDEAARATVSARSAHATEPATFAQAGVAPALARAAYLQSAPAAALAMPQLHAPRVPARAAAARAEASAPSFPRVTRDGELIEESDEPQERASFGLLMRRVTVTDELGIAEMGGAARDDGPNRWSAPIPDSIYQQIGETPPSATRHSSGVRDIDAEHPSRSRHADDEGGRYAPDPAAQSREAVQGRRAAQRAAAQHAASDAYSRLRAAGLADGVAEAALERAVELLPTAALTDTERLIEVGISAIIAGLGNGPSLRLDALRNRTLLFVGHTGTGKTTALVKAALALREQGAAVTIIGADVSHLGAPETLARYGALLRLPVTIAYSPRDLAKALTGVPAGSVALVDTPALSRPAASAPDGDDLAALLAVVPEPIVVLAVPAATGEVDLERLAASAPGLGVTALAITKLDEVTGKLDAPTGAGAALNLLAYLRLPPLLASTGRDVLADLDLPAPADLAVAVFDAATR